MSLRNRVRPNDPDTSWDAAKAQTEGKTAALQARIYEALEALGPMTYDQLLALFDRLHVPHSPSGVRSRTKELRELGWVRHHRDALGRAVKRSSVSGHPSYVWEAVPAGEHTGVDAREQVLPEREDRRDFDNRMMRAAIQDALRLYEDAERAHVNGAQIAWHTVAGKMAVRLKELHRAGGLA